MTTNKDLLDSLDEQNQAKDKQQQQQVHIDAVSNSRDKIVGAIEKVGHETASALSSVKGEVTVINPDLAKSQDVGQAVDAINKLNLTAFMQNEGLPQLTKNLDELSSKTQDFQNRMQNEGLSKMGTQLGQVVSKLDDVSKLLSKTEITVNSKLQKTIDNLSKGIDAIDFKPLVSVSTPETKVVTTPIDLSPIISGLTDVKQAIKDSEKEEVEPDLTPIINGLGAVQNAIQALRFPVSNYVLPFRNSTGKATQVQLSDLGGIPVVNPDGTTISGGGGGSGTQYTDGGVPPTHPVGNTIEWSDGSNWQTVSIAKPLPVTASISTAGLATSSNQTNGSQLTQITDGTNAANTLKSDGTYAGQNSLQVAGTYKEVGSLTAGSLNADLVPSTDVSGYRWIELQIVGTYSGTLTFQGSNDNSNFVSVPLMNSSTTRGSVGTTTTGTAIFYGPISFRYLRVRMTSYSSGTATGTLELHTIPSTMPTMAVGIADASQNLFTSNSTTFTSKFGIDSNLLGTLGTAFTTAGKVDIKGADGDVFVRQATAANLNATVVGTGTFAVQSTLQAGSALIGKVGIDQTTPGTTNKVSIGTDGTVAATQSGTWTVNNSVVDTAPVTQSITVIDSASTSTVSANGQSLVTGTATASSTASFALSGIETIKVQVTGTWTGTLTSEASIDGGTTWIATGLHQGAFTTSTFTANFVGGANVSGTTNYRLRATAAITGTATVKIIESFNTASVYLANAAPSGHYVSLNNSSTATLTSGSVFTGVGEDVSNFSEMRISVIASHASASNGLSIQQSSDNYNWDITDTYTIAATTGATFVVPRQAKYFRIIYTNGGTNQSSFRLQSILNRTGTAPSSQRASDGYTNETDLVQGQSFLMGYNGTTWDRLITAPGVTGTHAVGGPTASGSSVAVAPVTVGGRAATAPPTAVSNAQVVNIQTDIYGKQIVRESLREDLGNQQTNISSSTSETTIVTADATYKLDLYGLVITNNSATVTKVTIKDATAGTTRFVYEVPPLETRGFVLSPSGAHKQAAANNNWSATCGTSVATVDITALTTRSL